MKKFVKSISFIIILCVIASVTYQTFRWKDSAGITQFYAYDDNSMDVIFYGSSRCYCTINTALLWDKYGMAAYNMGDSGQNLGTTYYYMKESLKTQTPKVMAVEVAFVANEDLGIENGNLYRNTLNMKWSPNYIDNMNFAVDLADGDYDLKKAVLMKFPVIHSRYNELTESDFEKTTIQNGRYSGSWTTDSYDVPTACSLSEIGTLSDEKKKWIDSMIKLADDNNIQLVFFLSPFIVPERYQLQYNALAEYLSDKNIVFFNFNSMYQDINFDYSTDMRQEDHKGSHVNNYGAQKVTEYLGQYIHNNYNLEDRKNQSSYEIYQIISDNWTLNQKIHELQSATTADEYINMLDNSIYNYAIFINDADIASYSNSTILSNMVKTQADIYTSSDCSDIWELSDSVVLIKNEENNSDCELYVNKSLTTTSDAPLTIVVVNKKTGKLIEIAKFSISDEKLIKQ